MEDMDKLKKISESIRYIGVDDRKIDLFEGQYDVPNGIAYNSYAILDDKIAVFDTADANFVDEWLQNLLDVLDGRTPDYLIVSHLEPDHAAGIAVAAERFPDMKIVGNARTFALLGQFFDADFTDRTVTVGDGDTLSLGAHTLQFILAPMIHWPEVMMTYEQSERVLFSADAFGKFGALDADEEWLCEARRYYFNIVGKYGAQVQGLLKKAAGLKIDKILPLHGPLLTENLEYYIGKYDTWSSYEPEDDGVFIAYGSIYGNTAKAAHQLAEILRERGVAKIEIADLAREDMAEAVENAFRYSRTVLAASSYDGGVFPVMEHFLLHLRDKGFRNRKVAIIENGSWAPSAGRVMNELLSKMKDIEICAPTVTIRSTCNSSTTRDLEALADVLLK